MLDLLKLFGRRRSAAQKQTPFRYGIGLASDYVATIRDLVGMDRCYRLFSKGRMSFDDLMTKAAKTLVYANEDMEGALLVGNASLRGLELPKNTLMAFSHCLTSSRKDRDGDTLHADGAVVDPKMLLLWQHVHTAPIGKLLAVREKNPNRLTVVSCIVDMNELCHDSAVMVDNDMARFSHGFRALQFTQAKERAGDNGEAGFDVKKFEVMEESLVSVPANTDAEVDEILLGLVEGGKMKSPLMKMIGKGLRDHRPPSVPVVLDVKVLVNGQPVETDLASVATKTDDPKAPDEKDEANENVAGNRGQKGEQGGKTGTSKEAGDVDDQAGDEEDTEDAEVVCEKCGWKGAMPDDGKCPKCGAQLAPQMETEKAADDEVECPNCGEIVRPNLDGECPECDEQLVGEKAKEDKPKCEHLNEDGTFKDGFDGCVLHMQSDCGGNHSEESAKNICAKIARETGQAPGGKATEPKTKALEMAATTSMGPCGSLAGSWEAITSALRDTAQRFLVASGVFIGERDYMYVLGTFSDSIVVCVSRTTTSDCFKINWEDREGKPTLVGEPARVEIQTTTNLVELGKSLRLSLMSKAGRALSQSNMDRITKAKEHVDDVACADSVSRPHGAQLREASRHLDEVMKSCSREPKKLEEKPKQLDIAMMMAKFLAEADEPQRAKMADALAALRESQDSDKLTKDFAEIFGEEKSQ